MYYIIEFKETEKGIDLRYAKLYNVSERKCVAEFVTATAKGWLSRKAIRPDFDYVRYEANESPDGLTCNSLLVSDEVAQAIIAKYANVSYKIYDRNPAATSRAIRDLAFCEYITDPYDRG